MDILAKFSHLSDKQLGELLRDYCRESAELVDDDAPVMIALKVFVKDLEEYNASHDDGLLE